MTASQKLTASGRQVWESLKQELKDWVKHKVSHHPGLSLTAKVDEVLIQKALREPFASLSYQPDALRVVMQIHTRPRSGDLLFNLEEEGGEISESQARALRKDIIERLETRL